MATKDKALETIKKNMEIKGFHVLDCERTRGSHWRLKFREVSTGREASIIAPHTSSDGNVRHAMMRSVRCALNCAQG